MAKDNAQRSGTFLQRTRTFIGAAQGLASEEITALALDHEERLYVGTAEGLYLPLKSKEKFRRVVAGRISVVHAAMGKVFVGANDRILTFEDGKAIAEQTLEAPAVALGADDESLWLATANKVYKYDPASGTFHFYVRLENNCTVTGLACCGVGDVFAVSDRCLAALHGKRPRWSYMTKQNCAIPSSVLRCVAADKWGHLWIGTDEGVWLYDARGLWLSPEKIELLPKDPVNVIAFGADGTGYFGTPYGLRIQSGTRDLLLSSRRWLADDAVTAIAASADGKVLWVGTAKGLSRIEEKPMTLAEKAAYFQDFAERYFVREGYLLDRRLNAPGDIENGYVHISDNDGLWTGHYLAAMSFRYGATGDEEALLLARRSMYALKKLFDLTGNPGFPARAYRRPGDDGYGNGHPEWHRVKDENGPLEWKGETSSDEITGHLYGFSVYYDLCANEEEKAIIRRILCGLADHILTHQYTLCDVDGLPTTWAHWSPTELNRDDKWFCEKGINSLELLNLLKIAYHVSGDEKYQNEYERLIREEHYALNTIQHKLEDYHTCHIDDNLGFLTSLPLLRYEEDPALRHIYLLGLRHFWNTQRVERCPLWNLIYGALTGAPCDLENALQTMKEMPLDLMHYTFRNSRRKDLVWDLRGQEAYGEDPQLAVPLPYEERQVMGYDCNPFYPDADCDETRIVEPTVFLHPYWLGRYFGLIEE